MLPLALRQAASLMVSGRPGPVNVDVPFNVFQEEDEVELPPPAPPLHTRRGGAAPEEIAAAVAMIRTAKQPVLFVGHGVTLSEAGRELTELVHRSGIPVIASPNGMGCLDMADALSLGFIGRNGAYPANEAGRRADLVIYARRHGAVGLFAGAVSVAGFLAYLVAARSLPLGPVSALRETSVIFGAVLGTLVLKEGFGPRRIAAAVLVTVGIVLLAVLR